MAPDLGGRFGQQVGRIGGQVQRRDQFLRLVEGKGVHAHAVRMREDLRHADALGDPPQDRPLAFLAARIRAVTSSPVKVWAIWYFMVVSLR
nr:hypothetical protein [Paracoccus sp. 08]